MIISTADGRHRSELTNQEKRREIARRWKSMSTEEKRVFLHLMEEAGFLAEDGDLAYEDLQELQDNSRFYHTIVNQHYEDRIVTVDEFVLDDRYCGHVGKYFYDQWRSDLNDLFKGKYTEAIITGSIGSGKTTFCDMALAYMFYELCMLKDPQETFGLMPGSEIVLVCFNRDKRLARDVTFGGLKRKIEPSPFFNELGIKYGTSEMVYEKKNIRVIAVSVRSADAMGRDVYGGIIDETDFMEGSILRSDAGLRTPGEKSFAESLHESITRRMKSRYDRAGVLPGKLLLSSSARHKTSFTNRRIGEAANDPNVFCRDYAIYDVAPKERFSKRRFWVMVGNERIRHKILTKEEYRKTGKNERDRLVDQGCRFIHVPENFRKDFEANIEDAIRDIAGVVTVTLSPFIQMQDKIYEAIDPTLFHPMEGQTWATDELPYIQWDKITAPLERRIGPGKRTLEIRPRRHPYAPRHVHFDLSLGAQDAAGICIAHVVDMIQVERRTTEGDPILDEAPIIEVDLMLRIEPPMNGEINFAAVRGIVYDFMRHGYLFHYASADKFQAHDTIQQMEGQGIDGGIVSVDKTMEPYTMLKTALYEGRLSYYNYEILLDELVHLQRNDALRKVDHPPNGTKDCLAGDTGILLLDGRTVPIADLVGEEVDVYSCTPDGEMVRGRARNIHLVGDAEVVCVGLSNGNEFECTADHEIMLSTGEYKEAGRLEPGDVLMRFTGNGVLCHGEDVFDDGDCTVVNVDTGLGIVPVYDMTVDEHHNFAISAGVYVHNCSDALAGVVYTLSTQQSYQAPLVQGISEYERDDKDSEWIRQTMVKSGDKAPIKVGDVPPSGKPIIFTG